MKVILHTVLLFNLLCCTWVTSKQASGENGKELGGELISSLRNNANLDLSADEEYEDLRAELLAHHTALASLTSDTRRSMKTTTCWGLGGICVNYKLCTGYRFLTQVPGCKNDLQVCCFTWNHYNVRDMKNKGIGNLAMPWSNSPGFGGKGVVEVEKRKKKKRKNKYKRNTTEIEVLRSLVSLLK